MFHIDVQLNDTRTNTVFTHQDTYEYPGDGVYSENDESNFNGIVFYWTEGNFGCDCNRGDLIDADLVCNGEENIIKLVKITVRETGVVIYPDE